MDIQRSLDEGEVVLLQSGVHEVTHTLIVPSGGEISGNGATLRLADGADCHLIQCVDAENVRLEGLVLDGNRAGQTNGLPANMSHGVYARNVTDLTLIDVHCRETLDQAFKLKECQDLTIQRCGCDGAGTEGWSLDNCWDGSLSDVYAKNVDGLDADGITERPGAGSAWGFEIEDGTSRITFSNVRCAGCTKGGGFHVQAHGELLCCDLAVSGLIITDCPRMAFAFYGENIAVSNLIIRGSNWPLYLPAGGASFSNVFVDGQIHTVEE